MRPADDAPVGHLSRRLVELPADFGAPFAPELEGDALAVRVACAVTPARATAWARGTERARAAWISDFEGQQFSLGRAWYTHLEQDRTDAYFRDPAASDAEVERACPGLQATMRELASRALGVDVRQRPGWCGPGVHVFPAGAHVAARGGDIHFDCEGLPPAHARESAPALTLVLMLQPPEAGGGLRVWDARHRGEEAYEDEDLDRDAVTVPYGIGDLVVIDSYRLHQIQPFSGAVDRISATCHLAFANGAWESWF